LNEQIFLSSSLDVVQRLRKYLYFPRCPLDSPYKATQNMAMKGNGLHFLAAHLLFALIIVFSGCDVKQDDDDDHPPKVYAFLEAWSFEVPGGVDSSPACGDLNGDGAQEIVVGGRDGKIYAFHGNGDVVEGWPVKTGSYVFAAPAVGDINNDGMLEVVVISNDGKLYALTGKGVLLLGWPLKVEYSSPSTGGASNTGSPVLADVDGDEALDIIYPSIKYGRLIVVNHKAQALPGWPKLFNDGEFTDNTPAVGDIDGDGSVEIACGVLYPREDGNYNKLYVWNHDGTPLAGWPKKFEDYWWSRFNSLAFADINNDKALEIVFSDCQNIYVTSASGKMLSGWPLKIGFSLTPRPVVIADLNGDQNLEIIVDDEGGDCLFALDFRAVNLLGFPAKLISPGRLAVADINNDHRNEIIVGPAYTGDSYRAVSSDGTLVAGFSLVTSRYTQASPLVIDLDGDGCVDIVGAENNLDGVMGHLFVWSSDAPFNSTLKGWHKFHYDPQNSGMVPVGK